MFLGLQLLRMIFKNPTNYFYNVILILIICAQYILYNVTLL